MNILDQVDRYARTPLATGLLPTDEECAKFEADLRAKPKPKRRKRLSPRKLADVLGLTAVRGAVSGRWYFE